MAGNFNWKLYVDGTSVRSGTRAIPAGTAAFYTGYTLNGTHSVRVVIDPVSGTIGIVSYPCRVRKE